MPNDLKIGDFVRVRTKSLTSDSSDLGCWLAYKSSDNRWIWSNSKLEFIVPYGTMGLIIDIQEKIAILLINEKIIKIDSFLIEKAVL